MAVDVFFEFFRPRQVPARPVLFPGQQGVVLHRLLDQEGPVFQDAVQEVAHPHALALPVRAHGGEAVVPVGLAHERQAAGAEAGQGLFDGPHRVVVQGAGNGLGLPLSAGVGHVLGQERPAGRFLEVVHHDEGQPEQVVGVFGRQALLREGVPPMVHGAVRKLMGGVEPDLVPGAVGLQGQEDLAVLQLVPEAVRAPHLVVRGAAPDAGREGLVPEPGVGQQVEGRVRRLHREVGQVFVPEGLGAVPDAVHLLEVLELPRLDQGLRLGVRRAQGEEDAALLPGLEVHRHAEAGDAVVPFVGGLAHVSPLLEGGGALQGAVVADEGLLVARGGADRQAHAVPGHVVPGTVPVLPLGVLERGEPFFRQDDFLSVVERGFDEGAVELPVPVGRFPQVPFEVGPKGEAAGLFGQVAHPEPPNFEGLLVGHEHHPLGLDLVLLGRDGGVSHAVYAFVGVHLGAHRLPARGPERARLLVPDIDVPAPVVPDQVLIPAGDAVQGGMVEPGITGPGLGQGHPVGAGGHDVHPGPGGVRARDDEAFSIVGKPSVRGFKGKTRGCFQGRKVLLRES